MKINFTNLFLRPALIAGLGFMLAGRVAAQDDAVLYSFAVVGTNSPNYGGAWPTTGLVLSNNVFYGLTAAGGGVGGGTVFSLGSNDTAFAESYDFATDPIRKDGKYAKSGLILSGDTLYGTIYAGGSASNGLVFAVHTNGTGYRKLHEFNGEDGESPSGNLALFNNTLYGTTEAGGGGSLTNGGTVFSIHTDGTGFTTVHDFLIAGVNGNAPGGATPMGGVIVSPAGTTLYGTTKLGGSGTNGTVFAVNTDGSGFSIYRNFQPPPQGSFYNEDGCWPMAGLVLSPTGDMLYGTTYTGGAYGYGTVFAVGTNGAGFRTMQSFPKSGAPEAYEGGTGVRSVSPLVFSDNGKVLYGTAVLIPDVVIPVAGITAGGTVFALTTDGSPIETLYTCGSYWVGDVEADGAIPNRVMRAGQALYGTMLIGGVGGGGIVYRLGLGLGANVSATPARAHLGDTIRVVVRVLNRDAEDIYGVRLASAIIVNSNGVVAAAKPSGPTMASMLEPLAMTNFTYLYKATNYGTVSFTAAAIGTGAVGVVTSSSWTSDSVTIGPMADLMVKSADPKATTFAGLNEFQQPPPINDQNVSQPVSSNGVAAYIVRLQNEEPVARTFVLKGTTNAPANWSVQVLAGSVNIYNALRSSNGWTTPTLATNGYLDLQVNLAPLPTAKVNDDKSILITALADSSHTNILDTVSLAATLVPVPVKVTVNAVNADPARSGYTGDSIAAGITDINAPLVPNVKPEVLDAALLQIGGLVADGVTPLVIKLEADAASIAQFPLGKAFVFRADIAAGGSLSNAPMVQRLALLQNGVWQWATDVVLSASSPIAYVEVPPILSDDLSFTSQPPELFATFSVQDTGGVQAGNGSFKLRKPPIALIHGYASGGDWGEDFKAILGNSRPYFGEGNPDNFVITVKYGQDIAPGFAPYVTSSTAIGPVYENTMAPLKACALMVEEALPVALSPLHDNWAFTRFDAVCHSQGGVLARMLCNVSGNATITYPFRNSANCNRGRFHRVVTIGSPHNGSRIMHYLLALWSSQASFRNAVESAIEGPGLPQLVANGAILSKLAQEKFDPFGEQIQELNGTGQWLPDPSARFHLVRTAIDNGLCPTSRDATPEYQILGLADTNGGLAVIPRGSDGVVDLDSMGGNVPPAAVAHNVFTVQATNDISHAGPIQVFGADSFQVASTIVAQHVIGALDQDPSMNANDIVFDSFPMPALLDASQETLIENFAASSNLWQTATGAVTQLPPPPEGYSSYGYQISFPSNLPPVGDVTWSVQVYEAAGITSDGVELTPSGTNGRQVLVTVDSALVGDVVLSATYLSVSNTVVVIPPTLVVSLASAGATMTGFQLLPANIALPVGAVVSPQFLATYSDGSSSLRYAAPGTATASSSQPSVVSVADPLSWQLSAVGTAQINVTWSGFTAAGQIMVFDPTTNTPPALSLQNGGNGQLTTTWGGFTTGYVLESSGDLERTNSWQPVATAPASGGGWTTVSLTMTNTIQFYRLRWDPSAINF